MFKSKCTWCVVKTMTWGPTHPKTNPDQAPACGTLTDDTQSSNPALLDIFANSDTARDLPGICNAGNAILRRYERFRASDLKSERLSP
jgi:hypothetical protein